MGVDQSSEDWEDFKIRHEAAVGYAQAALKSLVLVNGGAILSLLTFIGNANSNVDKPLISYAFACFGLGLFSALIAHGAAYWAQEGYLNAAVARAENRESSDGNSKGDKGVFWGLIAAILSGLGFLAGAFLALDAIL